MKLQYDPSKEPAIHACLREIRSSEDLEQFQKKSKFGHSRIKELRQNMANVSGKMLPNRHDVEYIKQMDFEVHIIQKALSETEEKLKLKTTQGL
jgi:hypothetical protein